MEVVSQLVGQGSQPRFYRLKAVFGRHHGLLRRKFGNGACDGDVEAAVKGTKFRNFDRCAGFISEVRHGLANIAIVPDHLLDGKALIEEIAPVQSRHSTDFRHGWTTRRTRHSLASPRLRCLLESQRVDELIKKSRDSVRQLVIGYLELRSAGHQNPTPINQERAVRRKKVV
jgi:hypothetical protein